MSICALLSCEKGAGILSILLAAMKSYIDLFSFEFAYKIPLFAFLIFCVAIFGIIQLYNKPISFLCLWLLQKKNGNANNTTNVQEEEAPLKSSSAIASEVRRLNKISNELDKAQGVENKRLIEKYTLLIIKILNSLKININIE